MKIQTGKGTFLNAHGVNTTPVYWPDEKPDAENYTQIIEDLIYAIEKLPLKSQYGKDDEIWPLPKYRELLFTK